MDFEKYKVSDPKSQGNGAWQSNASLNINIRRIVRGRGGFRVETIPTSPCIHFRVELSYMQQKYKILI